MADAFLNILLGCLLSEQSTVFYYSDNSVRKHKVQIAMRKLRRKFMVRGANI